MAETNLYTIRKITGFNLNIIEKFEAKKMRMWMVDPKMMCRKHLLGEHVELHMLVGHIGRKRSLDGYFKNNCVEPSMIWIRHYNLSLEMYKRGYKHKSDLKVVSLDYLGDKQYTQVDSAASLKELLSRCKECRSTMKHGHS